MKADKVLDRLIKQRVLDMLVLQRIMLSYRPLDEEWEGLIKGGDEPKKEELKGANNNRSTS